MFEIIRNIGAFIMALGILVAVHEWGHFIIARKCGVKVLRFSIGFGKPLYKRITSTGMEFVIAAIPLGGYVRMLDSRVDDVAEQDKAESFDIQPVWKRFAIVAAGPGINFLFAILILMVVAMIGQDKAKPFIGEINPESYMAATGIEVGDRITAVDGAKTKTWQAVNIEFMRFIGGDNIPLSVEKPNGQAVSYEMKMPNWEFDPELDNMFTSIGFEPFRTKPSKIIALVLPGGPSAQAGLQENDEILKLNGTFMDEWGQIVDYVKPRANETIEVEVLRNGGSMLFSVTLGEVKTATGTDGRLGISSQVAAYPEAYYFHDKSGPFDALVKGTQETWRLMTLTVEMLGKFINGDVAVKNLSGPISIAQGAGMSASYGIIVFLGFLALISVNLGIINLLPLPMLDGGHLMYFIAEWITGKPVPDAVQEVGFRIGGVLLFTLMAVAIFNDINRIT
ncbi:RIP metalloprotease RseP [Brumicola pallidula]|uniref:Zinc metalloprotease n=1 Tax=Brumicola pallidula DSM 14239 = ACAM 615 TaxID=1121922 RepID=K6YA79_9ALTE|nr:RIP metalloprotease RseP [Glaciecola pallidula]GAC29659.1 regulator of sigma E protease [Glaciecola pallidula DSM 14239 = ACAM 615]